MLKLLLTLLFCCLIVALTDALEENSKDLIADKVEKLTADKLFVKREAIHEAGKMKGKDSKKKAKKNNKKKTSNVRKKKKTNGIRERKKGKNTKNIEGNGKKAKQANKSKKNERKKIKIDERNKGWGSGKNKNSKATDTMQQYCHDDMEDVLDDLPTSKTTVYCCNNGDVTSTQCGGLGQLHCKDACVDKTCVKFHPRPEEAVCHHGDNHMIMDTNVQGCKTVRCGASARRSCACCLNRGYYMSCMTATNPDNTCRCKCQCNKYKYTDLCDKMEMWCSQCKKYKRLCTGYPMSNTTEQETVGSGGTDTFTSISPGETGCREGSYEGIWPAKIGAIVSITNLKNLIEENYQEQNLVTWNTNETQAFLALPDWKFVSGYSGWCSTCPGISLAGSWGSGAHTNVTTIPNLTINQCRQNCMREVCKGANWNMASWECVLFLNQKGPMTFDARKPWCALSGTNNKEIDEI